MRRTIGFCVVLWIGIALQAQSLYPDFSKMNFGCDGNSITAGEQWSKTVVELLGFSTHHNVAVGSATWACHSDHRIMEVQVLQGYPVVGVPQKTAMNCRCGIIMFLKFTSRNSLPKWKTGNIPFPMSLSSLWGQMTRTCSAEESLKGKTLAEVDVTTMAGGARWAIQTILEHYPKCRVFVCTPIQTGDVTRNERNLEKIAILREICRALSVQLIDCYSNSGITEKFEQPSGRGRYLRDGLHPDKEGQELMGRYIAKEIRNNFF